MTPWEPDSKGYLMPDSMRDNYEPQIRNSDKLLAFWQTKEEKAEFFRDISQSARSFTIGLPENPLTADDVQTISAEVYNKVLDSMNAMTNSIFPVSPDFRPEIIFIHPEQAKVFDEIEKRRLEDN